MAGKYTGLQARIKEFSPLAEFVPGSAHSLHLVGVNAVENNLYAVNYFGIVQSLYVFLSSSTHRWELVTNELKSKNLKMTPKALSQTRWSAQSEATKALRKGYGEICNVLRSISEDCDEKQSTKGEAKSLLKKLEKKETAVMTVVWDSILQRIQKVSQTLQASSTNLSNILPLLDSLSVFIQSVRENFYIYEREASSLVLNTEYKVPRKKTVPKSRSLDEVDSEDVACSLTPRRSFIVQFHYAICDSLLTELGRRRKAYAALQNKFLFLYKKDVATETLYQNAELLCVTYKGELENNFGDELAQFRSYVNIASNSELSEDPSLQLQYLRKTGLRHTFPNVDTVLQLYLTLPCTNCSSERLFSVLKRIKNRLRSNISQEKLDSLSLLCIENDVTRALDFEDVIDEFSKTKSRKKSF